MIPNADAVPYAAEARVYTSDIAIWEARAQGYGVSGANDCKVTAALSPNANTLNVVVTGGVVYNAHNSIQVAAVTSSSPLSVGSAPTLGKWLLVEVNSSGTVSINSGGNDSATPEPPTITAGSTVLAAIYMPPGATTVEAYASGNSTGKGQIIDKRQVGIHPSFLVGSDDFQDIAANKSTASYWSVLNTPVAVAAKSVVVGDVFIVDAGLRFTMNSCATLEPRLSYGALPSAGVQGGTTVANWVIPALPTVTQSGAWGASAIFVNLHVVMVATAAGFYINATANCTGAAAVTNAPAGGTGAAAGGWSTAANRNTAVDTINAQMAVNVFNTNTSILYTIANSANFDLGMKPGNSTNALGFRGFTVTKFPV